MPRLLLLLAWLFAAPGFTPGLLPGVPHARAQEFNVPGLERDTGAYLTLLKQRSPAGLTPQARRQAEQQATDAQRRNDWPALVAALEARLGGGTGTPEQWMALGRAQLRRTPPEPARAAQAAWQAYGMFDSGGPEIPALLLMADAFRQMSRFDVAIRALEAAQERAPDDAAIIRTLRDTRLQAGIQVRRVRTEPEGDPPQACIEFTTAPSRRGDFVAADWVQLDPATPGAAITREKDQICIAGLRLGATTRVTLRAGLPGEDGLKLNRDTVLPVAMANREARLSFDTGTFLLPRGQSASVTLSSVNLSRVKLKLLRVSERNVVPWSRDTSFTETDSGNFERLQDSGKLVWEGTAEIPRWQPNQLARTALPLPDAFAETGAYILQASPGDGTSSYAANATQVIMRTDLAPTVWRGTDGLTVQVRSFADAAVRPGVSLRLLARSNDVLAEATTNAEGVARFAAPLLRGEGPQAPQNLHASLGADFVALDLTTAAFDLSDRGVGGMAHPGPLDAFAWTDRGIYRPGETVQLMALLRDAAGQPQDVPAHVIIKRPNGQVFQDTVPARGMDGAVHAPVALSLTAPAGEWSVEVVADPKRPAIGRTTFRVDAFVPDRMAVELTAGPPLVPGKPYAVPVTARFLYGAPAANLTGSASLSLVIDPDPPAALPGYRIGLEGEQFAPEALQIDVPATDADGRTSLPIDLKSAPDTTRLVRAELDVGMDDPSGRASHASLTIPIRPAGNVLGIKPGFEAGVDDGAEATFEMAAVNPDGVRVAVPARMKLVRERPDWRLVRHGALARYETVYRDEPIEAADVTLPASGAYRFAKRLPFGRYRIEVAERGGLAATSVRFRSGWVASDSADTPDKVDVSTDRKLYRPGDTARIHVVAPFAGRATLLTLTDGVRSLRDVAIAAGGTDIDVPVDAAWGPGAYATVHVFRGAGGGAAGGATDRPARAIGLAWIGLDPAARTLPVAITVPDKASPRARLMVPVRTTPGAWITLAAVDEGVLRLTKFATPDPMAHFLGRRTLGLDIRDDWGRLIRPGEGEATVLKQGGDSAAGALPEIPQKVVALFSPPVQAGVDGIASVPFDMPDFNGQVRLMAVAWQGNRIGSVGQDILIRDPLIAEPLLPRFLAPGDEARLAVLLQNLDLPAGEMVAAVTVEGPLQLAGETRLAASLAPGAQVVRTTTLRATGAGRGIIRLAVTGPGGFAVVREAAILVRPARAPVSVMTAGELAPRAEIRLEPALSRMVPGTGVTKAAFGGAVRYDASALLRSLADYPLSCLEQVSSRGLPLAMLPDGPLAGADRAARLQAAVATVLDRQRYDGGFGLWSASGEAEGWLSAYATEFLLRARKSGAAVPDGAVRDAVKFLSDALEESGGTPEAQATRAYDLYVLALAGQPRAGANRLMAADLGKLPTPLARAQIGAALALSNDRPRAEAAFASALDAPARHDWDADRGSALRDQVATMVLLKESGLLGDRLPGLIARLPGADLRPEALSTQEQAWAAAAAAVLGREGRPVRLTVDGRPETGPLVTVALTAPSMVRNTDEQPVWQSLSTTGIPLEPPPAARNQMRVSRRFFTLGGDPLNLDALKQNTIFVLLVEGRAEDGQDHRAMLLQGLPAGWEIAGRLAAGKTSGMPWLGELTETESQPATDDRFAATMLLGADQPGFRVAVRLRAVTPGTFELPGAVLSDMYRPGVFARQVTGRIKVLAPE
ncbi:MAG: alpha-2-macroglobulin family protein [Janthinobacterium lividum]